MNTKIIGKYLLGILGGCFALLFLFSCSLFHHSAEFDRNLTQGQLESFVASIKPYRGDAKYHYSFACYLQRNRNQRLAIQEFKEAIKLNPIYVEAYNGLGVSYDAIGKYTLAVEAYRTALALKPDLDYVLNNLGYSFILQGDIDSAIQALQRAVALNENNSRYHNNLGLAYSKKGLYELAFDEFKAAEGKARAHYNIAQIYYEHHLYEQAGIQYAKSLAADPASHRAREGREASKALAAILLKEEQKPTVAATDPAPQSSEEPVKVQLEKPIQPKKEMKNSTDLCRLRPFELEISNGNGIRHMAKRVGDYLKKEGFSRPNVTNADNFHHPKTMIYYRQGYLQEANLVARQIPKYRDVEMAEKFLRRRTKVKVVIGKDLISYRSIFSRS